MITYMKKRVSTKPMTDLERQSMASDIRIMSKKINQRLVRAEKNNIHTMKVYADVMHKIDTTNYGTKSGARFKESLPLDKSDYELRRLYNQIASVANLESLTKQGIQRTHKKISNNFKDFNLTNQEINDLVNYFQSAERSLIQRYLYDSAQEVELIQEATSSGVNLFDTITEYFDLHKGMTFNFNELIDFIKTGTL